jgi:signal transduction histidine kinase
VSGAAGRGPTNVVPEAATGATSGAERVGARLLGVRWRWLLGSVLFGLVVGLLVEGRIDAAANVRFAAQADEAVFTIERGLDTLERSALGAAVAAGLIGEDVEAAEWGRQVVGLGLEPPVPGLRSINAQRIVARDAVPALEALLRRQYGDDMTVRAAPPPGDLVVIVRVAPIASNLAAVGLDLNLNPAAAIGVRAAIETGRTGMSDALQLVQDPEGDAAVVLYTPNPVTPEEVGAVVVQLQPYLDGLQGQFGPVSVRVEDDTVAGPVVLATSGGFDAATAARVVELPLARFGQVWNVTVATTPAFLSEVERLAPAVAGFGTALLALLGLTVLGGARSREERATVLAAQRTEELHDANEALRGALLAKDAFLGVVSHELRTPLTVIRGFAATLGGASSESEEIRAVAVDRIEHNAARLDALVTDLLVTARLRSGREWAEAADVALDRAVADAVRDAPRSEDVSVAVPDGLSVWADPRHVARILDNLLSNARKYGVPPVRVGAASEGDSVRLWVADDGPGVDPDRQLAVFERFDQGAANGSASSEGVGLGLAIVRDLCDLNGGSVVYVDDGPGARFDVVLPAHRPAGPPGDTDHDHDHDRDRVTPGVPDVA